MSITSPSSWFLRWNWRRIFWRFGGPGWGKSRRGSYQSRAIATSDKEPGLICAIKKNSNSISYSVWRDLVGTLEKIFQPDFWRQLRSFELFINLAKKWRRQKRLSFRICGVLWHHRSKNFFRILCNDEVITVLLNQPKMFICRRYAC